MCVRAERQKDKNQINDVVITFTDMATKKIRPNCGPCALCSKTKFHYSHPCEWNPSQLNFVKSMCSDITMTSCICKACILDIKGIWPTPRTYRPRWEKIKPSCKVPGCKSGKTVKTCKIADSAAISQLSKLKPQSGQITLFIMSFIAHYHKKCHSSPI